MTAAREEFTVLMQGVLGEQRKRGRGAPGAEVSEGQARLSPRPAGVGGQVRGC